MNITSNTVLDLPPDGKFQCTTITVVSNVTLRFNRNALNTPVYLLATSNVLIQGTIDVSGEAGVRGGGGAGGAGGFDGGMASQGVGVPAGDGLGPGRGRAGDTGSNVASVAGYASFGSESPTGTASANRGLRYGNSLIVPMIGGSGGGGSTETGATVGGGGGGGGGALLIASDIEIFITGSCLANGGGGFRTGSSSTSGPGSGGGIRLVAPRVKGTGTISANGGGGILGATGYNGGNGRIRIDTLDRSQMSLNIGNIFSVGRTLTVFPAVIPRLDILEAAGTVIPEGTNSSINITLPIGAPTNQLVRIQAKSFQGIVPVNVVITPENGPSSTYAVNIDMGANAVAETNVTVTIPPNTLTKINAWTR